MVKSTRGATRRLAPSPRSTQRQASSQRAVSRRTGNNGFNLTPSQEREKERWEAAVDLILDRVRTSPATNGSPYDHPGNVFERELYRLICRCISTRDWDGWIESAVLARPGRLRPRVTLAEDPFFWGLKAVEARTDYKLRRDEVTRLAKLMRYARLHEIEPDLFTGFVMQTGKAKIFRTSVSSVEPWFAKKQKESGKGLVKID